MRYEEKLAQKFYGFDRKFFTSDGGDGGGGGTKKEGITNFPSFNRFSN